MSILSNVSDQWEAISFYMIFVVKNRVYKFVDYSKCITNMLIILKTHLYQIVQV